MGRLCTICTSPRRAQVDTELAGAESPFAVARRYKLSADALRRHKAAHLSPALVKASIARYGEESARAAFDETVARVETLVCRLEGLLSIAEERKSLTGGANVAREIRQSLELIARLRGELDERPQVAINVLASPEVAAFTAAIARFAANHPELRAELVREFDQVVDVTSAPVGELTH